MKRIVSLTLVLVLALTLAIAATSCKSSQDVGSGDGGKYSGDIPGGVGDVSAETLEALSNSGKVTIYDFTEGYGDEEKEFDNYFSQVYGGTLDRAYVVWEGWESKFVADFAGNSAPDVIYLYSKIWPKAASRQMVFSQKELKEMGVVALDHPVIADSLELSENNFKFNGQLYSLDVYLVTPAVMAVNDTLLKQCGVSKTPTQYYQEGQWTWNNFLKVCEQVCSIDSDADGNADYLGYNGWSGTYVLGMNAAELISLNDDGTVQTNFDKTEVINGLQMIRTLYGEKKFGGSADFKAGKVATLVFEDYNVAKNLHNDGEKVSFDFSIVPLPTGPDNNDGYVYGGCEAYAIVTSSQNPQGALNYIIARHAFDKQYTKESVDDLEYWMDDEGDQMLDDMRSRVTETVWSGVGNTWNVQWEFWDAVRTGKSTVAELLNTYKPVFDKQCEVENSYRD